MAIPDPVFSMRLDEEVLDEIRTRASRRGMKPSELARHVLEQRFKPVVKPPSRPAQQLRRVG